MVYPLNIITFSVILQLIMNSKSDISENGIAVVPKVHPSTRILKNQAKTIRINLFGKQSKLYRSPGKQWIKKKTTQRW